MKKLGRTMALMASLAFLAGTTATIAQEKKADTKKPADTKKATEEQKLGKVEIYQSKAGGFRFRVVGADEKNICGAYKDYETKEDCLKVVEELKNILTKTKPTEVKADKK